MKKLFILMLMACCGLFCLMSNSYAANKFCKHVYKIQIINHSSLTLNITDFGSSNDLIKGYIKGLNVMLKMQQPCEESIDDEVEFAVQDPNEDGYCYFRFHFDGDWSRLGMRAAYCEGKLRLSGIMGMTQFVINDNV